MVRPSKEPNTRNKNNLETQSEKVKKKITGYRSSVRSPQAVGPSSYNLKHSKSTYPATKKTVKTTTNSQSQRMGYNNINFSSKSQSKKVSQQRNSAQDALEKRKHSYTPNVAGNSHNQTI